MQKFFANTFLSLLSLVFAFFIAELFTRLFLSENREYEGFRRLTQKNYVARPYVMGVASPIKKGINSLGYRGELPKMPKPKDEYRVVVIGGSTVYGSDKNQLVKLIQRELSQNKDVKVYNFGVLTSVILQDYIRLTTDIARIKPDLVVSYSLGNDFYNPNSPGVPHNYHFVNSNPLWQTTVDNYPSIVLFLFGSKLLRRVFRKEFESFFLKYSRFENFQSFDNYYSDKIFHYIETLNLISNYCRFLKAKFLVVIQPVRGLHFKGDHPFDKSVKDFYHDIRSRLKKRKEKYALLDLSHLLKDKSYWEDLIHVNKAANLIIANEIAKEIETTFLSNL